MSAPILSAEATLLDRYNAALAALCEHGIAIASWCRTCEPPLVVTDDLCDHVLGQACVACAGFDDYDENAADDRFARYGAA